MTFTPLRVGAGALAAVLLATPIVTAGSGAQAQDRAEPVEQTPLEQVEPLSPPEPQVRFVASETVQEITPEQAAADDVAASDAATLAELVAETDTSALAPEVRCLAQAIYFEARGESLEGQLAVARVIINRAESDAFPDDYCSVVTQRSQFSFVRGGRIPEPGAGAAWTRAQAVARIAHRDQWDSPAGDALYFHATHVRPRWAGRMTARATINRHIFYR
ncbi:cell wall hydrolase [Aurantiacibacter luteus]|uniref:Cell wall hydrolase SleB domain-containing protein n=1 Tax=Aurantiacibacter luteus TaxID=1581420 RepID=A0A0G9MUA6_9SPHN|nr:cell wall hydrolase [Aurantiacibacter luteus]KLE34312.1 hypothetical protein AAW00_08690 [Aurantiacibacter luteus]